MNVRIDHHGRINVLIAEPSSIGNATPVLLFLHGRGEAGDTVNRLPLVMVHHTPPFQAVLGRLADVIVVAPQAPHDSESDWQWAPHRKALANYLAARFGRRKVVAAGFSRGGLGVLAMRQMSPRPFAKWAVVDPQAGSDDVLPENPPDPDGWLAYGPQFAPIKAFSQRLARGLEPGNVRSTRLKHIELALKAFGGDRLGGAQNLYEFLGLGYAPIPKPSGD